MSAITEDEAKTRWCPFVRVNIGTGQAGNRLGAMRHISNGVDAQFACIGSACMAWRELHPKESREDHSGASGFMAERGCMTGRIVRREGGPGSSGRLILDAVGFCGLAGKP